ncbi:MAG: 30S ribosomal protein S4 [Elusimicrobia bacterium RIFOXYA2_FULL_50_26]|nr:MAG: 30S ribosomal protein S4 [Elusimicrobia bacterium RIFOXYA2_FULL_50_26]OGS25194.1 MAG: 30S ribosomal protein S4 [Elusimicrobia bacterium RIFOXYB2_FULL_50_12]
MSRYIGSVCKQCRREREKMFLKGERCTTKCTLEKKRGKNLPGQHGVSRSKMSEYSVRLREKQKARRVYGLNEEQFRHYFARAERMKGLTGENLLKLLETRLDNVVYRLGIATSRKLARQIVTHGHVRVNDRKVDLPSYQLKAGDKITLKEAAKENIQVKRSTERPGNLPSWLSFDKSNMTGTVAGIPMPDEFAFPIRSQLIVELYSK